MTEKFAPRLRHTIKRGAFLCLWPAIAVVAWGELTPHPPQEVSELLGWDKAQHFTAYFGLALLGLLGWAHRRSPLVIFIAAIVLGGTLELLQAVVGRDAEWGDMLANTLGAATGTLLASLLLWLAQLVDHRRAD
jgi:VanZ family protein